MGRYRRYENYVDSGIAWLGELPAHWQIKKLKFLASVSPSNVDKKTNEDEQPARLCNYTDVYYNELILHSLNFMQASATRDQIKKLSLRAGDTIITKDSEDPTDIAIPAYVPETLSGVVCGYHLALIRPKSTDMGPYLKRLFESRYTRSVFATQANGLTRYGLGTYSLNNIHLPSPPLAEAITIATFIDHETAKIDRLIARQERLIELLKEKRQAVISHAVTKGLNPDAPMKDSDVEWLGEVPTHWDILQFRHLMDGGTRNGLYKPENEKSGHGVPFVQMGEAFANRIFSGGTKDRASVSEAELETWGLSPGDLLFARRSIVLEGSGRCTRIGDIDEPHVFESSMIRVRPKLHIVHPGFIHYLLDSSSMRAALLATTKTVTISGIDSVQLKALQVPLPPRHEQEIIEIYLSELLCKFDKIEQKSRSSIALLQEHRTALISAAVTGKIDVRAWRKPNTETQEAATAVNA